MDKIEGSDWVSTRLRVRYAETDQMGVAYYAHYLTWFEVARGELCRVRNVDYAAMEMQHGLFLPIVYAACRYHSPARYDDLITISVQVSQLRRRSLQCRYRVTCETRLLAEGETHQVVVDKDGRPRSFPADIALKLANRYETE